MNIVQVKTDALKSLTVAELLCLYGEVLDELRGRQVVRSSNNPLSDYAERLFCDAFGWTQKRNSAAGYDATDNDGKRYQIKARRLTSFNRSRQLSAIRKLDGDPFDALAGVLVDERFQVLRACLVPVAVVRQRAARVEHTNSWKFMLVDDVWTSPDVRDVTEEIRAAAEKL